MKYHRRSCCGSVCVYGCVCAGTGRALSNEQHIHLMGLTFNQSTYSLSPPCLKNTAHQWDRKWHTLAHVCECPSRGPLTIDLLHSTITTRGVARIWEMRKGCGPLRTLPLMKISELVELVGLASLVSYHISPYLVHLSFWVTCASWKWLVLGAEVPCWGPRGQDTRPRGVDLFVCSDI